MLVSPYGSNPDITFHVIENMPCQDVINAKLTSSFICNIAKDVLATKKEVGVFLKKYPRILYLPLQQSEIINLPGKLAKKFIEKIWNGVTDSSPEYTRELKAIFKDSDFLNRCRSSIIDSYSSMIINSAKQYSDKDSILLHLEQSFDRVSYLLKNDQDMADQILETVRKDQYIKSF